MRSVDDLTRGLMLHRSADPSELRGLSGDYYRSEAFLKLEQACLFDGGWVALGREDELAKPGDYFTTQLGDEPLLVVRDSKGVVRILSNVCRHRGMVLAEGSGNAPAFACSYHGWTYRNDGRLLGAPLMQQSAGFDRDGCSLPEFRTEFWGGFIFVNLDGEAEPLAPRLATIEPLIRNYHMPEMRHAFSEEVLWQANWKSLVENFMEGYHLSVVHSQTLKPITPTHLCEYFEGGEAYMGYKSHYPENCPERGGCHSELTPEECRYSVMLCIYPGLLLGICPHQLLYMCVRPKGAGQVEARWGLAVHGDISADEIQARLDLYRQVNAEDKAQLEKLSQGLASAHFVPGPLAPQDFEGTIRDFHQYLARELAPPAEAHHRIGAG